MASPTDQSIHPFNAYLSRPHPSWTFRIYVIVIIRFCTKSRRYSTEVPWGSGVAIPLPFVFALIGIAAVNMSDCRDWASHSLFSGVVLPDSAVGTAEGKLGEPAPFGGIWGGVDLKEDKRFWAEDFLRMAGR